MIDFMKIFSEVHRNMGINSDNQTTFSIEGVQIKLHEWEGSEVPITDTTRTPTGIFYKGERVIVYIRDWIVFNVLNQTLPKYHLVWCSTLDRKYKDKTFSKYVVSVDTNGIFKVNLIVKGIARESKEKLHVCKNCLQKLNWKGYSNSPLKEFIYDNFSLEEFFQKYKDDNKPEFHIMPEHNSQTAIINNYTEDWEKISKRTKRLKNYTCEECGEYFPNGRGLHVHHRNTIKSDNRPSNLQVLCADCHQKKHPDHKIIGSSKWDDKKKVSLSLFDEYNNG